MMTREQARNYFEQCGLTYNDITLRALKYLQIEVDSGFNKHRKSVINGEAFGYWIRVNDAKYFKGKYAEDGHVICAFLTAKGTYFSAREVVAFNRSGFVGFCGEADNETTAPVLETFCEWCDWLRVEAKGDAE